MQDDLKLYQTLLAQKRLRGLGDLYFFTKFIAETNPSRREFLVPHVHGEWSTWYHQSKARIKLILVPRGHFKSTVFTVADSLRTLAGDRNSRILIANATLGNSQNFLGEIKDHIRKNQIYQQLYTDYKGVHLPMFDKTLKWNENEIEITGRDTGIREPSITAVGVGGNLVSQHYSKIIGDDLVNSENSATRYQAEKVIDWWKKSFSLLDPDGEMILIGTRWAYYELYSYILEHQQELGVDVFIRGSYNPDGSIYFPEKFDEKKLLELKALHGSYIFSSFYLNNPVDEDSALIKKSQILYHGDREDQPTPKKLEIFAMVDPAVSQEVYADYSTIVIAGVDYLDNWFVLEVRRGKWTVGEMIGEMFDVNKVWKPNTMSIEVIGQAQSLMTPIHDEEDRRARMKAPVYLPLVEIKSRPQATKESRMRAVLQPRFERGKVFIKRDMHDLIDELMTFPKSKHDDIIDALTDLSEIAYPATEETEKETYSSNIERKVAKHWSAINKFTGGFDEHLGESF